MPPLKRMLSSLVLIVLILCLSFMSLLFVFQGKLIFFPSKGIGDMPGTIGLDYEDVYLVTVATNVPDCPVTGVIKI